MPEYILGGIVKGKVTGIENYGIFVLTDTGYTGLVHISEISDKFVRSVFDYVQLDDVIFAKIISIDDNEKKLKLSIKNFNYRSGEEEEIDDTNGFGPLRDNLPIWIEEYKKRAV